MSLRLCRAIALVVLAGLGCESTGGDLEASDPRDASAQADAPPPLPDATFIADAAEVLDAALDAATVDEDAGLADATTGCVPACWLRECGDDGCGGSCGTCLEGASCGLAGRCDCPESTCDGLGCGVSSCGRVCGLCDGFQTCVAGVCSDPFDCAGTCRDRNFATRPDGQRICAGETGLGACTSDPTRAAVCTCEGMDPLVCDACFLSDPVGCRPGTCTDAERCNLWTGRCVPADAPLPPPGGDIGQPCADDGECRSAGSIGAGLTSVCRTHWPGGYCMSYCNPPPNGFWASERLERSNCPPGALCAPGGFLSHPASYGACLAGCEGDGDCRTAEGYFCRKTFGSTTTVNGVCTRDHCRSRPCPGSFECGC